MAQSNSSKLIINIADLLNVHRVEKQRVEFKRSWNTGPTSWQVLQTICAFANDFLNEIQFSRATGSTSEAFN